MTGATNLARAKVAPAPVLSSPAWSRSSSAAAHSGAFAHQIHPQQDNLVRAGAHDMHGLGDKDASREAIHSGHFMISNVPQDDDDAVDAAVATEEGAAMADGSAALGPGLIVPMMQDCGGPIERRQRSNSDPSMRDTGRINLTQRKVIDSSLSKLFECMTLAYKAKLTSPKWNNFKGLKLRWTIKIRLNNVIWRAWHMQFVKQVRPLIAPFAIEVDQSPHNKMEAVVLEGKYWKRRLSIVSAEYRRWRVWYKDKATGVIPQQPPPAGMSIDGDFLERFGDTVGGSNWFQMDQMEEPMMIEDFNFLPDFSDALLTRLTNQPFAFPNPREIAQAGNADFIQPGLLQLQPSLGQPSLEDLMDTLEPLQEFFASQNGGSSFYGFASQYSNYGAGGSAVNDGNSYAGLPDYWRQSGSEMGGGGGNVEGQMALSSGLGAMTPNARVKNQLRSTSFGGDGGGDLSFQHQSSYPAYGSQSTPVLPRHQSVQQQNNNQYASAPSVPQYHNPAQNAVSLRPMLGPAGSSVDSDSDDKKDARQRSMSGPILGQPLIDPSVLTALAGYNRSVSASSGQLSQEAALLAGQQQQQPPKQQPSTDHRATLAKSLAPNMPRASGSNFVVPQVLPRGKERKNCRSSEAARRSATKHTPPLSSSQSQQRYSAPHNMETSTLAQLLTCGVSPFAINAGGSGSPASGSTPGTKKIAPKPAAAVSMDVKPQLVSPPTNPFSSFSEMVGAGTGQNNPVVFAGNSGELSCNANQPSISPSLRPGDVVERPRQVENRRINHITAEQKRRGHIKSGFEILHGLVPSLAQSPCQKISKAVVLHKGAEFIHQLKEERRVMQVEAESLKQQIETINQAVVICQQQLPATGAPVSSRARNDRMNEMLDEYIRNRTMQNWKFWLFSHVMRPLFENYAVNVSTRSVEDLCQTCMSWVDQQCSLVQLRPVIKESMRKLSTTTHVLSDPARLPEEARKAVFVQKSHTSSQPPGNSTFSTFPS